MRARAVVLLLLASASTQFGGAYAVTLFERLGATGTAFARLAIAAAILLVVVRPRVSGRSREAMGFAIALGAALAIMNGCFYVAIDHIPIGPAVTLEFLGPLGVAVWSSRRRRDLVWVGLAAVGVMLLGGGGSLNATGVTFALLAGVAWAAYILLAVRVGRTWPGASGLAVAMVAGALFAAPLGIAQGGRELLVPALLGSMVIVALASSVVPYTLEIFALREIPQGVFGVLMSLDPAMAALAGLVVLGQGLAVADIVAVGCVVVASAGATYGATRGMSTPPATA